MKALAMLGTAVLFAAAPASIGFIGNASLSQDVPVRLPATATLLDSDGHRMPSSMPRANAAHEQVSGEDAGSGGRGADRDRDVAEDSLSKTGPARDDKGHDKAATDRRRGAR